MKKVFISMLALLMMVCFVSCGSENTSDNTSSNSSNSSEAKGTGELTVEAVKSAPETDASKFKYEDIEGGVRITSYDGEDEIVVTPSQIDGKPVIEIGGIVNNKAVKGVRLGGNVKKLGDSAFINDERLEIFISNENLESIDGYSFCNTSLNHVELKNNLKEIGACVFDNTHLKSLYIPANVEKLDNFLYYNAEKNPDFYIETEAGSAAEKYAKENGIKCVLR